MASLRKRPEAEAIEPAVAVDVETGAAPAPESQNGATEALARQIEALNQSKVAIEQQAAFAQVAAQRRQEWLGQTPGAKENISALGHFHQAALDSGLIDTSPEYFNFMETQLAALKRPAEAATHIAEEMQQRAMQSRTEDPPPRPSRLSYSAPVSRDVPTSNGKRSPGKITLTAHQVEAAKIAGISPEEYARQLIRKNQMVASGEYGEQQR